MSSLYVSNILDLSKPWGIQLCSCRYSLWCHRTKFSSAFLYLSTRSHYRARSRGRKKLASATLEHWCPLITFAKRKNESQNFDPISVASQPPQVISSYSQVISFFLILEWSQRVWKDKSVSLSTKKWLVDALVFPLIKHGSESWVLGRSERKWINSFEIWAWRKPLRISWVAKKS